MSSKMSVITTHVMKGPTIKINLMASCNGVGEAITETFVIDNLVQVRLKVKCVDYIDKHFISMLAIKHELAKNDAISMNVICNALKYSKKSTCADFKNTWEDIGVVKCSCLRSEIYLSQIEILLNVHTITKPAFPKLYEDIELTDFTLSTADGKVAVHKACLAAHSPVFKVMFTGTWKEAKENFVEIKNYTLQTIQHLKDFLYLGTLPDEGLRPLIALAAQYSINDLIKECAWKLAETVQPADLFSLHEFACANNIPELSCAISQLTLDGVIHLGHQIRKNDENKTKLNAEKQAEGQ